MPQTLNLHITHHYKILTAAAPRRKKRQVPPPPQILPAVPLMTRQVNQLVGSPLASATGQQQQPPLVSAAAVRMATGDGNEEAKSNNVSVILNSTSFATTESTTIVSSIEVTCTVVQSGGKSTCRIRLVQCFSVIASGDTGYCDK